jgi:hypothetical protein
MAVFRRNICTPMNELEWIRRAIQTAYPNPHHLGCPTPEALAAIARRTLPATAEEQNHIFHCSPCFATYLGIRNQIRRSRIIRLSAVWTCSTVLLVGLTVYTANRHSLSPPQQFTTAFNLQERPVFRGTHQAVIQPAPFVMPRGIVHLSLTLPLGSQAGPYQLQICRTKSGDPLLAATGAAAVRADGSTVLTVDLESASLRDGQYALGIRRGDGEWSYSPLLIRDAKPN